MRSSTKSARRVTLDGNSVDLNQEKAAAGENAIQYEAAASFASQMIKMLAVAIKRIRSAGVEWGLSDAAVHGPWHCRFRHGRRSRAT